MPVQPFPIENFEDAHGNPLSNGYIIFHLNTDCQSPAGQVYATKTTKIPLDENGEVVGTPTFWSVSDLNPEGSYYVMTVYSESGELACGPLKVII